MYRMFTSKEQQRESNDRYAHTISLQFCQLARDSATNILSQNANFASVENEREVIRFLKTLKADFMSDIDVTIENLQIQYFNTKGGE